MNEPTIQLDLSVADVNLILEALGDQPFKSVYGLVSRLQIQAREQLQPPANGLGTLAEGATEPQEAP
jgi:hypothetical protein